MYREFEVRWRGVLPADPKEVWDAVTLRADGWVWPIEYEPRLGGAERGLTSDGGKVTAWQPPAHFQTRAERPDGWFNALDYTLEPHVGGTLLRFVQISVLPEDDYDRELDACRQHTAFYYHSLGEYVAHFAGRKAEYVEVEAPGSFAQVCRLLGLPEDAKAGDAVRLEPAGLPAIEGTVDYLTPMFLGVRTPDALIRVYGRDVWGWPVGVALHLFAADADAARAERDWSSWLNAAEAVA